MSLKSYDTFSATMAVSLATLHCTDDKRNKPEKKSNAEQDYKGRGKAFATEPVPAAVRSERAVAGPVNPFNADNTVLFS
jgi:hypothetical protein